MSLSVKNLPFVSKMIGTFLVIVGIWFAWASAGEAAFEDELEEDGSEEVSVEATGDEATYTAEWTIQADADVNGTNQFNLGEGSAISYDIEWTPESGSVSVGVYNHNTGEYSWEETSSSPNLSGTINITDEGLYSFAVRNSQDHSITTSGSYTIDH